MDVQLAWEEYGSGHPLLLLHGNNENSKYFDKQIAYFATHFHVFAVDTRGHGRSARGVAPFTLAQFAEDLGRFMDDQRIAQAHILGYSDGGNIALLFALRYPKRVTRLVLNGANLYPRGMLFPLWLATVTQYGGSCLLSALSAKANGKREMLALMATQPHISPASLSKMSLPTLVIVGTHDLIRRRHTLRIAKCIPNAQLCLLPGGHTIAQEQSPFFNREVLAFLTATTPAMPA